MYTANIHVYTVVAKIIRTQAKRLICSYQKSLFAVFAAKGGTNRF